MMLKRMFLYLCVHEQVSTATVCVQRADGARTAPSSVTVIMELPALQTKEPANVLQDTEAPPVRGVSPASALHATARSHTGHVLFYCSIPELFFIDQLIFYSSFLLMCIKVKS